MRINTALSEPLLVRCGVPQGSILGPLLFTVYANVLPSIPQHCSTDCYVDDTKLLMSSRVQDCESTVAAMDDDLITLRNWCFDNMLRESRTIEFGFEFEFEFEFELDFELDLELDFELDFELK